MSWSRPPTQDLPVPAAVMRALDATLHTGAVTVRDHLGAGTPVKTGRLQGGWEVERTARGWHVPNHVSYVSYVTIDSRSAAAHIDEINGQVGRTIDRLFRRNHG